MTSVGDTSATFCATLVDEWLRAGVSHAVIAPGSRSTPLAVALAARKEMNVHLFHDERSASFGALGIGVATGRPAVLLCTSGTAATHFHGAVAEADLSCVPMIVCTADRPPELKDVGAPQTIDQTHLYGTAVRWFHDPGVPSFDASTSWRSLASRSFASSLVPVPGPVHLNLPFREPLLGEVVNMPPPREGAWWNQVSPRLVNAETINLLARRISGKSGVVIAGRGCTPEVLLLAKKLKWPVFADSRSGLRNGDPHVVMGFDAILRSERWSSELVPEVLLRVGEPPASKVLSQWVSSLKAEVLQILPHSTVSNPDHRVAHTIIGDIAELASSTEPLVEAVHFDWLEKWSRIESRTQKRIDEWTAENMSEPTVARVVTKNQKSGSHLVVSSSMPIRDVEWYGDCTPDVFVHSNRGANGIDGVVSTAVGVALATNKQTTVLIGDVACIHDSNGMWALTQRNVDLKIVVINNDGGSIFSFLPQASALDAEQFEFLFGTPHGVSFEHLAKAHGVSYLAAHDQKSLAKALATKGTCLIEVQLDRTQNVSLHGELNAAVIEALS